MKIIGIALIILGAVSLAYGGFAWTSREKVVDLGALQVTRDRTQSLPMPPIAGGVCLVSGVLLIFAAGRRKT